MNLEQGAIWDVAPGVLVNTGYVGCSANSHRSLLCIVVIMGVPLEQACECDAKADALSHVTGP